MMTKFSSDIREIIEKKDTDSFKLNIEEKYFKDLQISLEKIVKIGLKS